MVGWSVDSGTPLIGHGAGDAGIGLGTLLPAGWTGTEFVLAAGGLIGPPSRSRQRQDVGVYQRWKVLEPETGTLARVITELIWLDYLVWFAYTSVDSTYWILYCYTGDAAIEQQMDECQCFLGQLGVAESPGSPVHAASAEIGAGRERDQHVPVVGQEIPHIATVVLAYRIAWLKVTAPCIPASGRELIAHSATVLTRHKNSGFHKAPNLPHHDQVVKGESLDERRNLYTPIPDSGIPNSEFRMAYGESWNTAP